MMLVITITITAMPEEILLNFCVFRLGEKECWNIKYQKIEFVNVPLQKKKSSNLKKRNSWDVNLDMNFDVRNKLLRFCLIYI